MFSKKIKGFTLIELIVVIGIIAILMTIVIIAVNPARQFGQARNTDRRNAVLAILNATHQYSADTNGQLPTATDPLLSLRTVASGTIRQVCNSAAPLTCASGTFDMGVLITGLYLTDMPKDPGGPNLTAGTNALTQYNISRDANNRVTVTAINEEANVADGSITVTR